MLAAAENALVAALQAHALHQAKKLKEVGTLPKLDTKALLQRYASHAPALYVLPGELRVRDGNAYLAFAVAGVVRNAAGHAQARKGDGIDLGLDHLLIAAVQAIHEKRLGGTSWNLTAASLVDDPVFDATGVAAIEMAFESGPMELPAEVAFDDLDDFETFHGDIDIAPHVSEAEHQKWLQVPPDFTISRPEADMTVQLPGASNE